MDPPTPSQVGTEAPTNGRPSTTRTNKQVCLTAWRTNPGNVWELCGFTGEQRASQKPNRERGLGVVIQLKHQLVGMPFNIVIHTYHRWQEKDLET